MFLEHFGLLLWRKKKPLGSVVPVSLRTVKCLIFVRCSLAVTSLQSRMSCDRSSKQPATSDTNYPDKDLSGMPQSKPAPQIYIGMFAYVYFTVNGKHDSNAGPRWAKYTYTVSYTCTYQKWIWIPCWTCWLQFWPVNDIIRELTSTSRAWRSRCSRAQSLFDWEQNETGHKSLSGGKFCDLIGRYVADSILAIAWWLYFLIWQEVSFWKVVKSSVTRWLLGALLGRRPGGDLLVW